MARIGGVWTVVAILAIVLIIVLLIHFVDVTVK